ncbi:ABC transporter ATP-binding protein [Candidatus Entotheonella palauensis]|uniref:ABC transporter ATP-binding protein n=1 Tax=Candidatus Entotheonella palauensis TaxID=93172 RepID=UPI0004AEB97F|nr:ABC transporter ATP-binding protein [Candidatus Entotheonella palauensis]
MEFRTRAGVVPALDRVQFEVRRGETVGVVGEQGAGKSVTACAVMGLLGAAAWMTHGRIVFGGVDVTRATEPVMQKLRGSEIAMLVQNPRSALNPMRPIGWQIEEVLLHHVSVTRRMVRRQVLKAMARVQIPDAERLYRAYPYELSEELCQRVLMAMALSAQPTLLIADNPTAGFDITAQAAIMDLIKTISLGRDMATLLFTHDLALAAAYCDRMVIMYAGQVVEQAPTAVLLKAPRHPYTAKLIGATLAGLTSWMEIGTIPGHAPDLRGALPPCRFAARCDRRLTTCNTEPLPYTAIEVNHDVACWNPL